MCRKGRRYVNMEVVNGIERITGNVMCEEEGRCMVLE